ncbi:MAG: hypothetical protein HY053_03355 [Proteobacteria bacterium]|nr:hypothetical protein [Pseudomonadota bacterium]
MDEQLRYDLMVENALRRVVADTLKMVAEQGLPGSHHFYISFLTDYPGVQIPPYLHEQYPKEMTIVLQYQYYGLVVTPESFSVTLSFNNVKERLTIPLAAITTFADPSVNFALQFQTVEDEEDEEALGEAVPGEEEKPASAEEKVEKGVVVNLDQFRKKPASTDEKKT